ncbi:MAG: hypothetical protein IPK16_08170 [Anaerolineales bacterium]|nr:hypothetical protein [Anaerolineales bacterium]
MLPEAAKIKERSGLDTIALGKYEVMEKENTALIEVLQQYGIKVWRPEQLSRERVVGNFGEEYLLAAGAEQQYTRDPFLVIGNNVIENTMGSLRGADILGMRSSCSVCWTPMRWVSCGRRLCVDAGRRQL